MVVHVHCTGNTPVSWLGVDNYNVVPVNLESDVLTNLFGGVDRGGGPSSADDTNTTVIGRPRRKAGVPARFLCRIYASYDDNPSKICDIMRRNCDNNHKLCLYRYGDMKKAFRKTEFEYRCFPSRTIRLVPTPDRMISFFTW